MEPTPIQPQVETTLTVPPTPPHHNDHETYQNVKHPRMAGFWKRFGAALVDGIIITFLTSPFTTAFRGYYKIGVSADPLDESFGMVNFFSLIFYYGVTLAYFGWFYTTKGRTPGKQLFKLKVLKDNSLAHLSWSEAFIRECVMKTVSAIPAMLGYFWYFASPKRKTWHDSAVDSVVVETDEHGNVLMDGPATYPVSKLRAFGYPAGCCLIQIAILISITVTLFAVIKDLEQYYEKAKEAQTPQDASFEYDLDQESTDEFNFDADFDSLLEETYMELDENGEPTQIQ